jgi:hypothetical protein
MCRALIVVMQSLSKDSLGEGIGFNLEESTFEQFRRPDLKLLSQSANHRTNAELYATLLGYLANSRFITVTDRFLAELERVSTGQVVKDVDSRYENLVRGLKHIQIKVESLMAILQLARTYDIISTARFGPRNVSKKVRNSWRR